LDSKEIKSSPLKKVAWNQTNAEGITELHPDVLIEAEKIFLGPPLLKGIKEK